MSASLAAVPTTVCTTPEATSTPICAFIPKCHWLPFLVWCISGSRALSFVLRRRRGGDDGGIDDCSLAHQQAPLLQHRPDLVEQRPGQVVLLQPMAEVQHRRRVRNRRPPQVDARKVTQGLALLTR